MEVRLIERGLNFAQIAIVFLLLSCLEIRPEIGNARAAEVVANADAKHVDEGGVQHNKEKYFKNEKSANAGCKEEACIWGYEKSCKHGEKYKGSKALCKEEHSYRFFKSLDERAEAFWKENDFGYILSVNKLNNVCEPETEDDSSFACNEQLTYCKGRHIFMDFRWNGRSLYERAERKPFEKGQFGGSCKFHPGRLSGGGYNRLMSWKQQIEGFQSLNFKPSVKENCDVTVTTPTIFMDLDFTGSLYHHFCDFFNLYLTLHVRGSFSKEIDIATWDKKPPGRLGPFKDTWKAFTTKKLYSLWNEYEGKKVCFSDVTFALLPRMPLGMYYSSPLVPGCSKSGMFHAFSKFIMNNLNITQNRRSKDEPLRITFLSRSTQWRRIVNEKELASAVKRVPGVVVKVVDFNKDVPFLDQLQVSHNTDVFIGIHGAGLAHALFLPDWALLFELYNTEDVNCYRDLARLRGVSYLTWQDRNKLKDETENPHPQYDYEKFKNYRFDVQEFSRLFDIAIRTVQENLREEFKV